METEEWMWAQRGHGCCISAVVTVTVGQLHQCKFLQVQHVGSGLSLGAKKVQWECTANGADYAEKWLFIVENVLY